MEKDTNKAAFEDNAEAAELYSRALKAQYKIAKVISSASSEISAIRQILEIIGTTLSWQIGILWTLDQVNNVLILKTHWEDKSRRFDKFIQSNSRLKFRISESLLGRAWLSKDSHWTENISEEKHFMRKESALSVKLVSGVHIPILIKGEVVAVVEFYSTEKKKQNYNSYIILETVVTQLGELIRRIKSEEGLAESINRQKAVFKSVPVGITVEYGDGRIRYANDSVATLFNLESSGQLVGKNIREIIKNYVVTDDKGRKVGYKDLPAARTFQSRKEESGVYNFKEKNTGADFWLKIKATLVLSLKKSSLDLVVKTFEDISQHIEDARQREVFMGLIGHELKSPLASIKAYIQLSAKRVQQRKFEQLNDYLILIDRQSDSLVKIINNLLDLTRIRAGFFQIIKTKLNYSDLLKSAVEEFRMTALDFHVEYSGKEDIFIDGDQDRLLQVIRNLLTNAKNYSNPGGTITVSLDSANGFAVTKVKDTGIGVPKKNLRNIFKLYTRVHHKSKSRVSGTGMGLFVSSAIINAHYGKIWLESKLGKGSEFIFELPVAR